MLAELAQVATDRAQAVQQLETDLATMSGREQELKQRIDALEKTPLAVAEHFAKLVAPGEKRSVMGDYLLFRAGVVVSTAIALPSRGSCDEAAKQRHVADGAARGR